MEGKKGHEMARMVRTQRAEYGHRSQGNMELPFKGTRDSNSWVARGYRWLKFGRISSGLCSAKKAR